jgi:hypothetical protein
MSTDFTHLLRGGFPMATESEPVQLSKEQLAAAAEGRPPELPTPPRSAALPPDEGKPPVDMSEEEIRSASQGTEPERLARIEFKTGMGENSGQT